MTRAPLQALVMVWSSLLLAAWSAAGTQQEPSPKSTLMIVLDAVPFGVVQEVVDSGQGYFSDMRGPVPLISTFPSTTSVALGGMLECFGLSRSPGYEARLFDWSQRRVRGGGPVSYFKIDFGWRSYFDWNRKGPAGSFVEAIHPVRSGIKRLRRAIRHFVQSDHEFYSIYIAATDTAAHVVSPTALKALLKELDLMLRDARARRPERPFDVVIWSDHGIAGGEPLKNVLKPLRRTLRRAGWRVTQRLRSSRDVALTPFGLVSSFEVYTEEPNKLEVAEVLTEVAGVDLCAYEASEGWTIVSARGDASVRRRVSATGTEWLYTPLNGDPLGYSDHIPESSGGPSIGWATDEQWFEATAESYYPDGLYRLAAAFDLVDNPASILCSLSPGFMYGSRRTEGLARFGKGRLRWTHGALEREASLGFLMSDAEYWRPAGALRFDKALVPFVAVASTASRFPSPEKNR